MPFALVKGGKVVEVYSGTRGIMIDDMQHPVTIFGPSWTDDEREAIGIYPIEDANTSNPMFFKRGDPIYSLQGNRVKLVHELVPLDVDDAKDRLVRQVNIRADGLINAAMRPEQQKWLPLRLCRAVMEHGADRATWPAELQTKLSADLEAFDYTQAIEAERTKRLAAVASLSSTQDAAQFDWMEGWPQP